MTIVIHFHQSGYRTFKAYYQSYVLVHLRGEFPTLVSYSRFVRLMSRAVIPLIFYLRTRRGQCTGISFVDSTPIQVCHNRPIQRNKVFVGLAARGKTSMGWFYGFKLHLVVNEHGEILAFQLTPGNVDDRAARSFRMNHPQTNVGAYTAPFYRGLTDEQCRLIHCASLEILERTGVLLPTSLGPAEKGGMLCGGEPGPHPGAPGRVGAAHGSQPHYAIRPLWETSDASGGSHLYLWHRLRLPAHSRSPDG
jgi:hypothetical protein